MLENVMKLGNERMPDEMLASSAETVVYDFFRNNRITFPNLNARLKKYPHASMSTVTIFITG